jgi:hypothetical protein
MILGASMASILVVVGLTNTLYQPANSSTFNICEERPWICEKLIQSEKPWWWWDGCLSCLEDILTIPENQSISVSVEHGPNSDTIMLEIPKALSSAMLNNSAVGFDPKPEPPGNQSQSN